MKTCDRLVLDRAISKAARNQAIAERYRAGASLEEISVDVGLSKVGVLKVLEKVGEPRRASGPRVRNAARDAEIIRQFQLGSTMADVGKRFGITGARVHYIIAHAGLNFTDGGHWRRTITQSRSFPLTTAG